MGLIPGRIRRPGLRREAAGRWTDGVHGDVVAHQIRGREELAVAAESDRHRRRACGVGGARRRGHRTALGIEREHGHGVGVGVRRGEQRAGGIERDLVRTGPGRKRRSANRCERSGWGIDREHRHGPVVVVGDGEEAAIGAEADRERIRPGREREPATGVSVPVEALTEKTETVSSPALATARSVPDGLKASERGSSPVSNGDPLTCVRPFVVGSTEKIEIVSSTRLAVATSVPWVLNATASGPFPVANGAPVTEAKRLTGRVERKQRDVAADVVGRRQEVAVRTERGGIGPRAGRERRARLLTVGKADAGSEGGCRLDDPDERPGNDAPDDEGAQLPSGAATLGAVRCLVHDPHECEKVATRTPSNPDQLRSGRCADREVTCR